MRAAFRVLGWRGRPEGSRLRCSKSQSLRAKAFLIYSIIALAPAASAEPFVLGGRTVMLAPPRGFCALDPHRPKEAAIIALNEQMQQPRNHVILQLADCD